jgi:2-dehydropantoate 2-reductase
MPIGEPDGRATPRLERIVQAFRTAGIKARAEPRMDAWLKTHAAFAVPLGQAVLAAGGPTALAADPDAVRAMIRLMRQNLAAMPTPPVPRGFAALPTLPDGRTQRAQQRHARHRGSRTRVGGRADARLCNGLVSDRWPCLPGRGSRAVRRRPAV